MNAAWDWALPRETEAQKRELAAFAAGLGFDTLVVDAPSETLVGYGHDQGLDVLGVVSARAEAAPADCRQSVHPVEEGFLSALEDGPEDYRELAHRWYPPVQTGEFLCFERERSMSVLAAGVEETLAVADGVALDGVGFRNHYACFCDRCRERRERARTRAEDGGHGVLRRVSESQLVAAHRRLHDHARSQAPDAVVMAHVWPPFAPDPYYGRRLPLDVCAQTVSWFYRPARSVERVEFEVRERARLEGDANTFVPFVGISGDPYQRRSPDRLARELEVATANAGGLVLCTLGVPYDSPEHARAVRETL